MDVTFTDLVQALNFMAEHPIELVFLNLDMQHWEADKLLSAMGKGAPLVLMSGQPNLAVNAFDYNAIDFLLLPLSEKHVERSILRFEDSKAEKKRKNASDYLSFVEANKVVQCALKEIVLFKAENNQTKLKTEKGEVEVHAELSDLERRLPKNQYVRVHENAIVRIDKIVSILKDHIEFLIAGQKIFVPISATFKEGLWERIRIL